MNDGENAGFDLSEPAFFFSSCIGQTPALVLEGSGRALTFRKELRDMSKQAPLGVTPTNRFSFYPAHTYWYIAAKSKELQQKPLQVRIWGTPFVLFRNGQGEASALLDRCAHRNLPLSGGVCTEGRIQCPYHGWQYDSAGICRKIPALCGEPEGKARVVPAFPTREQQGYIWVYTDLESKPNHEPFEFPWMDDSRYSTIAYEAEFGATLHATAENILDVPHTAFLHKGLFRGGEPNKIETIVRRYFDRVECQYVGEPRPTGIMAKLLAPGAGEVEHYDRFFLPGVAQVEYGLGEKAHLVATSFLTPVSDFVTRMYSVVAVRLNRRIPGLQQIVTPFALKVIRQDIEVLKEQTEGIQEFGGEQYVSTDVDLLGPSILRLLKSAAAEPIPIAASSRQGDPDSVTKGEMLA